MMESSLCIYKGKIQEAINLVPGMDSEYKLKAVQYWNAVSEHLQDIVNKSASDFTALDSTVSRHEAVNCSGSDHQQQMITNQAPQNAPQTSGPIETHLYNNNGVSQNNTSPITGASSNDLFYDEFLTSDTTECSNGGITSSSSDDQDSAKKEKSNDNINQTNTKMPSVSNTDISNNNDDHSLMQLVELTIKDQEIKDTANQSGTTSDLTTFATGSAVCMSMSNQTNQASSDCQPIIVTPDSNNLLANSNLTSRTSPLTTAYMIDTNTSMIPSSISMTSPRILICSSTATPATTSPADETTNLTISDAQTIDNSNNISPIHTSMMNMDSRRYVSSANNHITSGMISNTTQAARAQAVVQAHPALVPPMMSQNVSSLIQNHHTGVASHCDPIQIYHSNTIQHQIQTLNNYDNHHITHVEHSRPLQVQQHQLINYDMVGLNPEYNYIQTHFACDICGKQLDNSDDLLQHTALHNSEGSNQTFNRTTTTSNNLLNQHEKTTDFTREEDLSPVDATNLANLSNQHTCDICGKSGFSTKGNLKRHLRAHSGEKPFTCEYCDSRFTEKKSLKIHLRRHTGEKPYKCDICGKLFSQTGVLQSHMALHLNERKFGCNLCGKAFRQRSQLKLHIMRHEGVKRLECSTCSAKFLTKGDLERHYRIHTGERPYECKICKKTFTRQQSLNEHLNRHYGTKPYSCTSCDKTFSEMSACYKHAKIHKKQETN